MQAKNKNKFCYEREAPASAVPTVDEALEIDAESFSVYVPMPDGVRLAVDVFLPRRRASQARVSCVLQFTRYWRAFRWDHPAPKPGGFVELQAWLDRGFARVNVDARGSGASFGFRPTEYSPAEVQDQQHILDWIAAQPWSNGRVGTVGVSYSGNAAELAMVGNHPALRATIPRFTDLDWYEFILFPGGLRNIAFGPDWGAFINALDAGQPVMPVEMPGARLPLGVKPVDGDTKLELLTQALGEHQANHDFAAVLRLEFRDDAQGDMSGQVVSANIADLLPELRLGARPAQHWASWVDSGTAAGALSRYRTLLDMPMELIIGTWNHGAAQDGDPFLVNEADRKPDLRHLFNRMANFMSAHLEDTVPMSRCIHYKSMNERTEAQSWRTTTVWPPAGVRNERWYLQPGRLLSTRTPTSGAASQPADRYEVDYTHGTGKTTRWTTSMSGPVLYPDRAAADKTLLHYTSAPLRYDMRLCGDPIVTLQVSSSCDDAAVIVYLEHVAPDGVVRYVTEGQLRARSRQLARWRQPYWRAGPRRSFERADAMPLVPGEITELVFALLPTAVLFRAGDSIRIAIAGADVDSFERVPSEGQAIWSVYRTLGLESFIDLPVQFDSEALAQEASA